MTEFTSTSPLTRVWERITGTPASPALSSSSEASSSSAALANTNNATARLALSRPADAQHAGDTDSGLGTRDDDLTPATPTPRSRIARAGLPFASPAAEGDYQQDASDHSEQEVSDQDDDEDRDQRQLSRFSFGPPGSPTPGAFPTTTLEPVVRRVTTRARTNDSPNATTTWPKLKVPRWGSISDSKRRAGGSLGTDANATAGPSQASGDVDFDDLDDEFDCPSPLDGDEGIIIDDEACFVEECKQVDFLFSLPHEISIYVLLHLDFQSLLAAGTVSRSWRSLARDHLIWRDLFHREHRWRVREDPVQLELAAASCGLPSPTFASPPPLTSRRSDSRRTHGSADASGSGSGGNRLSRRLTDMMADLGNLSLSPTNRRHPNNPFGPPQSPTSLEGIGAFPIPATSTATPRRPASGIVSNPFPPPSPSSSSTSATTFAAPPARSRSGSTTDQQPPSLESSISSLPGGGPVRRASSATLPPLGPVPSPSLGATPSAPLFLDWPRLYRDRYLLERNWIAGDAKMSALKGHTDSVYCLQFDQHKVISGSRDRSIRIWDLRTNSCVKTLKGHEGSILCLQYDDSVLISGSSDCRIIVWDLVGDKATGKGRWDQKMTLVGHSMGVLDLCFDDTWIVSCSKDTTIRVWSRATGELYRVLSGHSGPVNAVQLLNGKVVSASGDSLLKLWDIESGEVERVFTGHARGLACVQYAPSGKLIATGSNDKTVKIWDAETGKCLQTMMGHTDLVRSLAFDETRRRIVSASYDRTLRLWDLDEGTPLLKFKAHTSLVFDVSFSASKIMSCSHDQKIVIQDFGDGLDVTKFL
ncbi:hypothetical protein RQP46_000536 [Phenoliferia psychrophenolica]